MQEPLICLVEQGGYDNKHDPGIDPGGQYLSTAVAKGVVLVMGTTPQAQRPQRQDTRQHVCQVVERITKQRQRPGNKTADSFGNSNGKVHQDGDEQVAPVGQFLIVVITHGALPFRQDAPAQTQ